MKRPMRICHVISGDVWGGAETHTLSLIRMMSTREDTEIRAIVFNAGVLYEKLVAMEELRVDLLEESKHGLLALVWHLSRIFRESTPDLVHVHGFKENFTAGLAALLTSIQVVRTHHGKGMIGSSGLHILIERLNARLLTGKLIAVSNELRQYLTTYGLNDRKTTVILNGYACDYHEPVDLSALRVELDISREVRVIGIVGRLVPVKNHRCFLDAAKVIAQEMEDTCFCIVGEGPLYAQLQAYTSACGLGNKVKFLGFRNDVHYILELFDLMVISSHHEGIPVTLLEAMCAGVPVVATEVGGIPEVISNGDNGLLVTSGDPTSLANACLALLRDAALCQRIADKAAMDIKEKFSLTRNTDETIQIYRSAI